MKADNRIKGLVSKTTGVLHQVGGGGALNCFALILSQIRAVTCSNKGQWPVIHF